MPLSIRHRWQTVRLAFPEWEHSPIWHNLPICGRYRLSRRKQIVAEHFDFVPDDDDWTPSYNIAPTQPVPIIRQHPKEPRRHRSLKLIVSTRPGSATHLAHEIFRKIDPTQVLQLPELQELNRRPNEGVGPAEAMRGTA
jgi:hypothetical protein